VLGSSAKVILVILFIVSLAARETALFLLTLALFSADALSRIWGRYCLDGIEYRRTLSRRQVTWGESISLDIEVVNRKLLPLPWLDVSDELPTAMPPIRARLDHSYRSGRALLANLLSLRPYERVRRRYTIPCVKRGEHDFGPARIRSGDLFGLITRETSIDEVQTLLVLPPVIPLTALGLPARQPLGELRTQSWLFDDPSRLAGARDYRPGDSQRRIHWAATARTQKLQSRVYEATTSHRLAVFLDLATGGSVWWWQGQDEELAEKAITAAAAVSTWGLDRGYQVGLATNGNHRGSWDEVSVAPASDDAQQSRLLVALARLQPFAGRSFAAVLDRQGSRLPFGTSVVVVATSVGESTAARLMALRARGHPVTILLAGDGSIGSGPSTLKGITVRRITVPDPAVRSARAEVGTDSASGDAESVASRASEPLRSAGTEVRA
jgi:uncharacterized protein (DUF58 family)